ncbi:hypothetical protein [Streptomyces leeuwenhoekii]|uniref:hypothetical protein n=1 Tax=Streptomyces leeuwenhoekii TaxID=1437453 RepID=UPI000A58176F|nr:hypothetical protein [Streptomyces leeuwenhoekii]
MKKFQVKAEATNRWTHEKHQVEGTISAKNEAWARVGTKETLDVDGYTVDQVEVREVR